MSRQNIYTHWNCDSRLNSIDSIGLSVVPLDSLSLCGCIVEDALNSITTHMYNYCTQPGLLNGETSCRFVVK